MATNYPTSIDSPTNPSSSSPMNNPSHAGEHTNANDAIVALETQVGVTGSFNFLPVVGGTMSGAIAMGANKITGLANGSASTDAAAFGQITAANAGALALTGGTMSGAIAMGGSKITGLANGSDPSDAVAYGQISGLVTGVSSVFSRTGAVTATSGDYTVGQVTGAAPLASPTFTGTVTLPDGTTATSSGITAGAAIAMGANKITGLANGSAATDAAAFGQIPTAATGLLPAGTILDYAGSAPPSGFLLCDGSAVSRSTYAGLFTAIGTTWGVGDGSTTFNLPDMQGRVGTGVGSLGTNGQPTVALAGTTFSNGTLSNQAGEAGHTLSTAELASHAHSHVHTLGGYNGTIGPFAEMMRGSAGILGSITASGSIGTDATTAGSGNQHNNMPPFAGVTKIIKT
jgi:microcystin-dependent protein